MSFVPNQAIENGGQWLRSTFCTAATCVEVRLTPQLVSVRDSKQNEPSGSEESQPILDVQPGVWLTFLSEVLGDVPAGANGSLFFTGQPDGDVVLTSATSDIELRYDSEEWSAFVGGVADGEFGPLAATPDTL
jgi:hypothetical protein